jgi:putative peptide zinc metalloprotease protein
MLIATIVLVSVAAGPVSSAARFLNNPSGRRQINGRWVLISTLLLAGIFAAVALIPLPVRVAAPAVTRPRDGRQVYVPTAGVLIYAKAAGEFVAAGETLARLTNRHLELEVAELASLAEQQRLQVAHLALRQHRDPPLGDQLPAAEKRLADLNEQVAQKRRELARLVLVAPVAGTVLPPPPRFADAADEHLVSFAGTPQQAQNLGCYLETGTLLCTIGDPQQIEVLAIVDESAVQGLREGQVVRLALAQIPGQILYGRVQEVSRIQSDDLPPQIVAERMIPLHTRSDGRVQPLHTYYQAVVALDPHDQTPLLGAIGWAKIEVDPQPLWLRAYRGLRGTLRTPW